MKVKIQIFKNHYQDFRQLCNEWSVNFDLYDNGTQLKGTITGHPISLLQFYYQLAKKHIIIQTFDVQ